MTVKVGDTWYRYEAKSYSVTVDADLDIYSSSRVLECHEYEVEKLTPKGVKLNGGKVVLHHTRKRFAHPTKRLALEAYMARKEKQIAILERQLARAKSDIWDAQIELVNL